LPRLGELALQRFALTAQRGRVVSRRADRRDQRLDVAIDGS
jgi:hypothetical protein